MKRSTYYSKPKIGKLIFLRYNAKNNKADKPTAIKL